MGSAFSKTKNADQPASEGHDDAVAAHHSREDLDAASQGPDNNDNNGAQTTTEGEVPFDEEMIMRQGLHEDVDGVLEPIAGPSSTSTGASRPSRASSGGGQSIQEAVADLKRKFNINAPDGVGSNDDLAKIREEMDAYGAPKPQAAAVDVKGKGRAVSDSSDSEDDSDSSDDGNETDSSDSSSSSSGSSLGFPATQKQKKRKLNQGKGDESDYDDDDDDDDEEDGPSRPLKRINVSAAVSANPFFASQHEIVNPEVPVASISVLPDDAPIKECGIIDSIIDTVIVVRAKQQPSSSNQHYANYNNPKAQEPDTQVLDEGSLLCLGDRKVLGPIFETFGAVTAPRYTIRLPQSHPFLIGSTSTNLVSSTTGEALDADAKPQVQKGDSDTVQIEAAAPQDGSGEDNTVAITKLTVGTPIFFSPKPDFSRLLFTREIRATQLKGSDASNLYDEEPAEAEIEFSDDEQEQEYKKMLKQQKRARAQQRGQGQNGYQNSNYTGNEEFMFDDDDAEVGELDYDAPPAAGLEELDHDGTATTEAGELPSGSTRTGQVQGVPPSPTRSTTSLADSGQGRNRDRDGASRGRGSRGRGRGKDRSDNTNASGRGRGGKTEGGVRGRGRGVESRGGRGRGSNTAGRGQTAHGRGDGRPEPPSNYHQRPSVQQSHGLPARPAFQHPDALPYDGPPLATTTTIGASTAAPVSAPPAAPMASVDVPPRGSPVAVARPSQSQQVEQYNPVTPAASAGFGGSFQQQQGAQQPYYSNPGFMATGYNPFYAAAANAWSAMAGPPNYNMASQGYQNYGMSATSMATPGYSNPQSPTTSYPAQQQQRQQPMKQSSPRQHQYSYKNQHTPSYPAQPPRFHHHQTKYFNKPQPGNQNTQDGK